jgi:hypothetical protein
VNALGGSRSPCCHRTERRIGTADLDPYRNPVSVTARVSGNVCAEKSRRSSQTRAYATLEVSAKELAGGSCLLVYLTAAVGRDRGEYSDVLSAERRPVDPDINQSRNDRIVIESVR